MNLGQIAVLIGVAFALAFLCESMVEYLFGTIFDKFPSLAKFKDLLKYISAAMGVGLALYWRIDLIAVIANTIAQMVDELPTWSISLGGKVLSGLAIGRGANYLHDFLSKYLKKPDVPLEIAPADAVGFKEVNPSEDNGDMGAYGFRWPIEDKKPDVAP